MDFLKMGESCGSCIHTNKPKTPRAHAAHYEVAKTERWCFKHNCHVTRETVCDDYEGTSTRAKTNFTRIKNFNKRIEIIRLILDEIGNQTIDVNQCSFFKENDWLCYRLYDSIHKHRFDTKTSAYDNDLQKLMEIFNINI